MSNPLFDSLGGKVAPPMMSPAEYLSQIKANPIAFIRKAGYNIPDGITNPQQMIGYLLQSGQIPQTRLAQAQQMAQRMK